MIPDQLDPPARRPTLSEVLSALAANWDQPRLPVAQLITALGDRGLIGLLLILAFANVIPNPPGTSAVLGLPMLYLSWQLMRGGMPWLPRFLAARSFDIGHFRTVVSRAMPYLNRVERLLRPRLPAFSGPSGKKLLGGICLILSIVLVLPIPFGNLLPAAAIAIIALGALERDGICIAGGVLFGIVSTVFMAGAIVVITRTLLRLLGI
ncbi:exopolysaccharide biosynthesis protein [Paracoccus liaowanqingii]|uniref:Exopolysaccharide biosynthesis protein n=1 Tax=Paracoccus liaowanqingii TaxID=2560053 RepID=A0A4Z1CDV5_9RHOB|nr:exopolysaccharide biosynthesis protein [Paracoccus liaowanqingii]TGN47064.1 exopolysaccharide biosynthesis protein [Paracoccus liaowanqingii]